jgi:hypothetical protein
VSAADRRIVRAEDAVSAHQGGSIPYHEVESIYDLLCDLRHLADLWEMDWSTLIRRAMFHYDAEVRGDQFSEMEA